MGLSESSLNIITKPFNCFYRIVRFVVIRLAVPTYLAMKITIASLMSIHMKMLTATAKNNK